MYRYIYSQEFDTNILEIDLYIFMEDDVSIAERALSDTFITY